MTAVRIAEEFGFELVLQHATEGYRVADILAKKKIPVSLTLIDSPGGKAETIGLLDENAAILDKAGVTVAINTDDSITESRFLLRTGSIAVRGGMTEAAALKALTLTPAKLMHLDHRLGSLEKGKDADFVILSGAPFSVYTQVLETYIDGKKVFDAQATRLGLPRRRLRAAGRGEAAGRSPRTSRRPQDDAADPVANRMTTPKLAKRADRIHRGPHVTPASGSRSERRRDRDRGRQDHVRRPCARSTVPNGRRTSSRPLHVTPGLIDPFCVAGLTGAWNIPADQDQDELSDPNQADLRVSTASTRASRCSNSSRRNGVTVVHTTPGPAERHRGADRHLPHRRLDRGERRAEARRGDPRQPRRGAEGDVQGEGAGRRGWATAALVRKAFADAQAYQANAARKGAGGARNPEARSAASRRSTARSRSTSRPTARTTSHTALRIAEEFKLKPVIALGTEAYRMADELKKAGVPVIVHPTMQRPAASMETLHAFVGNAAALDAAGVPITLCTGFEGYVPKMRVLRYEAAMAVGAGGLDHGRGAAGHHDRRREAARHRQGLRPHREGQGRGPRALRRRPVRARDARHAHAHERQASSTTATTT